VKASKKGKERARTGAQAEGDVSTDTETDDSLEELQADEETSTSEERQEKVGEKQGDKDGEKETTGTFSRRKVASNAWRYEEEESELPVGTSSIMFPHIFTSCAFNSQHFILQNAYGSS
jgi:hypothetical protein